MGPKSFRAPRIQLPSSAKRPRTDASFTPGIAGAAAGASGAAAEDASEVICISSDDETNVVPGAAVDVMVISDDDEPKPAPPPPAAPEPAPAAVAAAVAAAMPSIKEIVKAAVKATVEDMIVAVEAMKVSVTAAAAAAAAAGAAAAAPDDDVPLAEAVVETAPAAAVATAVQDTVQALVDATVASADPAAAAPVVAAVPTTPPLDNAPDDALAAAVSFAMFAGMKPVDAKLVAAIDALVAADAVAGAADGNNDNDVMDAAVEDNSVMDAAVEDNNEDDIDDNALLLEDSDEEANGGTSSKKAAAAFAFIGEDDSDDEQSTELLPAAFYEASIKPAKALNRSFEAVTIDKYSPENTDTESTLHFCRFTSTPQPGDPTVLADTAAQVRLLLEKQDPTKSLAITAYYGESIDKNVESGTLVEVVCRQIMAVMPKMHAFRVRYRPNDGGDDGKGTAEYKRFQRSTRRALRKMLRMYASRLVELRLFTNVSKKFVRAIASTNIQRVTIAMDDTAVETMSAQYACDRHTVLEAFPIAASPEKYKGNHAEFRVEKTSKR